MTNVTMQVLVDGVYGYLDGAKMRARPARAGDVVEVAGGWYAEELAAGGLVGAQTDAEPSGGPVGVQADAEPSGAAATEVRVVGRRSRAGAAA